MRKIVFTKSTGPSQRDDYVVVIRGVFRKTFWLVGVEGVYQLPELKWQWGQPEGANDGKTTE